MDKTFNNTIEYITHSLPHHQQLAEIDRLIKCCSDLRHLLTNHSQNTVLVIFSRSHGKTFISHNENNFFLPQQVIINCYRDDYVNTL